MGLGGVLSAFGGRAPDLEPKAEPLLSEVPEKDTPAVIVPGNAQSDGQAPSTPTDVVTN